MARISVGTLPVQIIYANPKRKKWEVQFLPSSIVAGNTGLVFIKRGSAPVANLSSNTWDHVLNAGATVGDNLDDSLLEAEYKGDVWAIADAAAQILTVRDESVK